ncbi:MAG: glutaminyl-peptide cyclotransferase [Acidobacteria bacterium]|nr:glutaminyl-peptide cyclotransferase [Acidobacteriota bacterium]
MRERSRRARRRPAVVPRPPRRRHRLLLALVALAAAGWALGSVGLPGRAPQVDPNVVRTLRVDVVRELPHDTSAYTQGLLWWEGSLYESTGRYGESTLRRLDPATGAVEQRVSVPPAFFGEGLARIGGRLIMLTWMAERAIVYDLRSFETVRTFRYRGEGWGLCHDGDRLVMSNGSDTLTLRDADTFEPIGAVRVTLRGRPQDQLNELECVDGAVYANVWQEDYIVRIDPASGRVTHQIDAAGLLTAREARGVDVLNGIAYEPEAGTFYITGKWWPKMFEVRFVE